MIIFIISHFVYKKSGKLPLQLHYITIQVVPLQMSYLTISPKLKVINFTIIYSIWEADFLKMTATQLLIN